MASDRVDDRDSREYQLVVIMSMTSSKKRSFR